MRTAYLDCFAGISGDMFLGALIDAGVPHEVLEDATSALQLGASLRFQTVDRAGISATKVHVLHGDRLADAPADPFSAGQGSVSQQALPPGHAHPHPPPSAATPDAPVDHDEVHGRSLTEIRDLLRASTLADNVKTLALRTFDLLGTAEAKIHNVPVDTIHFHEVGSVDAIVDIVASAAGIVHLRIDAWHSSQVNVGGGFVRCAHGVFPVPAPATALLLRGAPTYSAHLQKELVTPTGAALLRALEPTFGPQPPMTVYRIGYGAGTRNPAEFPNVLRLSTGHGESREGGSPAQRTGDSRHTAQTVTVLEAALDDSTPQLLGYVTEQALQLGALDVMLTPVTMKKGRPGSLLTVLCNPEDEAKFEALLLRETTTLGVRVRQDRRLCLDRAHIPVDTPYGTVRIKVGTRNGEVLNSNPEYEDCRQAAQQSGVPLKQVQAAAMVAYTRSTEEQP